MVIDTYYLDHQATPDSRDGKLVYRFAEHPKSRLLEGIYRDRGEDERELRRPDLRRGFPRASGDIKEDPWHSLLYLMPAHI